MPSSSISCLIIHVLSSAALQTDFSKVSQGVQHFAVSTQYSRKEGGQLGRETNHNRGELTSDSRICVNGRLVPGLLPQQDIPVWNASMKLLIILLFLFRMCCWLCIFIKVTVVLQRYLQEEVLSCHCDIKLYQTNSAVFCNTYFNTAAFYRDL